MAGPAGLSRVRFRRAARPGRAARRGLCSPGRAAGGLALEQAGRLDEAAARYRHALAEAPGHAAAGTALTRVELALRTAGLDRTELERRAGDGDIDAVLDLADLDAQRGDYEPAFDRLIEALRRTAGDDRERVRQRLVALLELPPAGDPRVAAARRAMANALF